MQFMIPMPKKLLYRLGEYRITDYENGRLSWERHVDFGVQRSGDGYLLGGALILGPGGPEENGFLIGEFLDRLKKLPVWHKTRFYCHASELLEVATGRRLTEDFLNRISSLVEKKAPMGLKPGMFRLGRYRIIVTAGNDVLWQTVGGVNRVVGGPGRIESGLLILGSQEVDEEGPKKRDFLHKLDQLPQWEETQVWCLESVLRECREPQPPVRFKEQLKERRGRVKRAGEKRLITTPQIRLKEPPKRLFTFNWKPFKPAPPRLNWPFRFNWRKLSRPWPWGRKFWLMGLLLLILSGLVFGVVVTFHSLEKMWAGSHGYKKHHH
jgi:hypothetical protein